MSRDDAPEDEEESSTNEEEPSTADRHREPERVIDADADVKVDPAEETTGDTETGATDTETGATDTETGALNADSSESETTSSDSTGDSASVTTDDVVTNSTDGDSASAATDDESASGAERATTQTEQTDADGAGEPAMRSGSGLLLGYGGWTLLMLFLQILATVGLVGVTAQSLPVVGGPLVPPGIPSYVYVYAGIGAVGYTFTRAVTVDVTTERIGDWTIRIFAALPLAAATYLLVTIAVAGGVGGNEELTQSQLALVALLTGLFVNTSYARLDAAADRLLGPSR